MSHPWGYIKIVKLVSSNLEYPIATHNASHSASGVCPKIFSSPLAGERRNVVSTYYLSDYTLDSAYIAIEGWDFPEAAYVASLGHLQ
jgi:hypothetical protein